MFPDETNSFAAYLYLKTTTALHLMLINVDIRTRYINFLVFGKSRFRPKKFFIALTTVLFDPSPKGVHPTGAALRPNHEARTLVRSTLDLKIIVWTASVTKLGYFLYGLGEKRSLKSTPNDLVTFWAI